MSYRGVILAGGKGTRLGELTRVTNKHLLPIGPEPMVLHPLRKLVGAGIGDILLVSSPEALGDFIRLLGSGSPWNARLTYRAQDQPGGIAQALALAEDFVGKEACVVLLGDNIFFDRLGSVLASARPGNALAALKGVAEPSQYGVAELRGQRIVSIEEKPARPKSDWAVVGIYVYPSDVFSIIQRQKPSGRGELEITDVNRAFMSAGRLDHCVLEGYWTDAGALDALALANKLVREQPPQY